MESQLFSSVDWPKWKADLVDCAEILNASHLLTKSNDVDSEKDTQLRLIIYKAVHPVLRQLFRGHFSAGTATASKMLDILQAEFDPSDPVKKAFHLKLAKLQRLHGMPPQEYCSTIEACIKEGEAIDSALLRQDAYLRELVLVGAGIRKNDEDREDLYSAVSLDQLLKRLAKWRPSHERPYWEGLIRKPGEVPTGRYTSRKVEDLNVPLM